jgi:hypothetical protein
MSHVLLKLLTLNVPKYRKNIIFGCAYSGELLNWFNGLPF